MSRTFRRLKFGNYLNFDCPSITILLGSNKKILKDGKNQPRRRNKKNTKRQINKFLKHRLNTAIKHYPYNKARLMANHNFFTI